MLCATAFDAVDIFSLFFGAIFDDLFGPSYTVVKIRALSEYIDTLNCMVVRHINFDSAKITIQLLEQRFTALDKKNKGEVEGDMGCSIFWLVVIKRKTNRRQIICWCRDRPEKRL